MVEVYILTSEDDDGTYIEGVFSSLYALEAWLKNMYSYSSDKYETTYKDEVHYKEKLFDRHSLMYAVHNLIV